MVGSENQNSIEIKNRKEVEGILHLCMNAICRDTTHQNFDPNSVDWKLIFNLASKHYIIQLVYLGITQLKIEDNIPKELFQKIKRRVTQRAIINLEHSNELIKIYNGLKQEKIRVIPYKGIILSLDYYKNIAARVFSDIDLLINKKDIDAIGAYLESKDYKPKWFVTKSWWPYIIKHHCDYAFSLYRNGKRKFHIEPHWALSVRKYQMELSLADLENYVIRGEFNNHEIEKFNEIGMFISTCIHHVAKEKNLRFKHIFDLVSIVKQIKKKEDWEEILRFGEKYDLTNIFLAGAKLTQSFYAIKFPTFIEEHLKHKKIKEIASKIELDFINSINVDVKPFSYWGNMRFQMSLRNRLVTKFKIFYYHILEVIQPNFQDINTNQEFSKLNYLKLFISRPFRILTRISTKD